MEGRLKRSGSRFQFQSPSAKLRIPGGGVVEISRTEPSVEEADRMFQSIKNLKQHCSRTVILTSTATHNTMSYLGGLRMGRDAYLDCRSKNLASAATDHSNRVFLFKSLVRVSVISA